MPNKPKRLVKPDVHPLIIASGRLLDRVLGSPEWDRLINITRFDIYSPTHCALGQPGEAAQDGKPIPGNGMVPWETYTQGCMYLDEFAQKHKRTVEKLGLEWDNVTKAFDTFVPYYNDLSQNEQWKLYLSWRRAARKAKKGARA